MSAEERKKILREAEGYVTKDRNSSYGEPEDNFQAIADIWNAQGYMHSTDRPINATDVALMMAGMKLARLKHSVKHKDSWVDAIGYLACGWDTVTPDINEELNNFEGNEFSNEVISQLTPMAMSPVEQPINDMGWVSDNRCTPRNVSGVGPNPHAGHTYGAGHAHWCDGYRTPMEQRVSDMGWVSDKRCYNARPHGFHKWGVGSPNSCDGYLVQPTLSTYQE